MKTKSLLVTTVPQQITVQTPCEIVTLKEDEAVEGWPTASLVVRKPSASDDPNTYSPGRMVTFAAPRGTRFMPGTQGLSAWLSVASGSTTVVQDEQ